MAFSGQYNGDNARVQRIVRWFERRGWKFLRSKANPLFCQVLMVSPDGTKVLKVARGSDRWSEFITWASKNPNPHYPHVYSLHGGYERGYVAAIMERLHDLKYLDRWSDAWSYDAVNCAPRVWRDIIRDAKKVTRGYAEDILSPTLRNAYRSMVDAFGEDTDLHRYNQMVRLVPGCDPVLVLLDPYA